jgi:glutamate/tyrosine decarboxylase-like PLP-dependent enzyme
MKVTESPMVSDVRALLGDGSVPAEGMDANELLREVTDRMKSSSLFNGHPRFWGYITSSAAPIGALGDFLAAVMNQNVGAWQLSPLASEIEAQTIRWIAEFVGYPADCGGLMVSGGNMANFVGFLAGRKSGAPWDIRKEGLRGRGGRVCVYCSDAAHTWVQKAADLFGLGTDAVRWIPCDEQERMQVGKLEEQVMADKENGITPLLVVATAGSVGTGSVDPINAIADLCERQGLWLHVDGAYGAMAAALPGADEDLKEIHRADSLALDPHKWLYSPLEAGCALVRDGRMLPETFGFHPSYYKFDLEGEQPPTNYYELGMQNSRGFRALKVWLAFRQVGCDAFVRTIRDDIRLARALAEAAVAHPDLEVVSCRLSIVTLRFVPRDPEVTGAHRDAYLNRLNEAILEQLQREGDCFLSNAVVRDRFLLRACIVNFRTRLDDVEALPGIVARIGRELDPVLRAEDGAAVDADELD